MHRWLDLYRDKLEEFPPAVAPVTADNWRPALGDMRRAADWIGYFGREVAERPWRDVLAEWWPRLLPGLYGGATHPVIRVGHAVRTLLATENTGPRRTELAHALGYWAARHRPVAAPAPLHGAGSAAAALDAVAPIAGQQGAYPDRLGRITALPTWAATSTDNPDEAHRRLTELVRAATHRYATHGRGDAVMLVHSATAPCAVLRTLPALPRTLWAQSLRAAWSASAAVTAMYTPAAPAAYAPAGTFTPEDVFQWALAHGDEHVIKLADTALDVGDDGALAAALRCAELVEPPA